MSIQTKNYDKYILKLRKKLKNKTISIISNNCIGGVLYHDLGIKFNSPTINTLIYGDEFVGFVNNLREYIACELEYDNNSEEYPIGKLCPKNKDIVHIHFLHNKNFDEAKTNWDRRKSRINYDNMLVIYEHFNKFSDNIVQNLDKISYDKIIFTHKKFKNIKSAVYMRACRKEKSFGTITKFKNKLSGKRNLYSFDLIKHINNKLIK